MENHQIEIGRTNIMMGHFIPKREKDLTSVCIRSDVTFLAVTFEFLIKHVTKRKKLVNYNLVLYLGVLWVLVSNLQK